MKMTHAEIEEMYKDALRSLLYIEEELNTFFGNVSLDADLMVKLDEMKERARASTQIYYDWLDENKLR